MYMRYSNKSAKSLSARTRFRRLAWQLTLLAILGFSPAIIRSQPSHGAISGNMERDFQAAMAAEDSGDLERAESLLSKLHNAHPGIFSVDESLGLLYASQGDASRALPLLQAAVREQPSSDAAHANLGAALYSLHRIQPALDEFEQAARINPSNFSVQQSLGRLWMESQRPDKSAKAFMAALRLKPADQDLELDCVTALLAADRLEEARKMLSTFADADHSARAQSLLGEADEKEGKFQSAAQHFARAAELDPSEKNAWQLGFEFLRHWTFEAAIAEFKAAAAKFPESERLKLGLGAAYFGNTNYGQALPVFADLLKSDPGNSQYAELLGISCSVPMQEDKSRCSELVAYAQMHPGAARIDTYAAAWIIGEPASEEHLRTAQALLDRATVADPKLSDARFQLGLLKQNQGDWKGSVADLEAALALNPEHAQAHYRLALAYWRIGRKEEGKREMELNRKFAKKQQEELDQRLLQITTFFVNVHN